MSSSPKSADERRILLVAEAGVPYQPGPLADPIAAWLDLMEAVEALCPKWPQQAAPRGRDYRL
jgi:hypothetical protein